MSPRATTREAGVTLIEMLVALAIFAVIGAAGFTVLNTVVRTSDRTEGRLEVLSAIDRALILFDRDLTEAVPGTITVDRDAMVFLRQTEGGTAAISYRAAEGRLLRIVRRGERAPVEQVALTGLSGAGLRLLDRAGDWHDLAALDMALRPLRAVELRLTLSPDLPGRGAGDAVSRLVALAAPVPE